MDSELNAELIAEMKEMLSEGKSVSVILLFLKDTLSLTEHSRLLAIRYFYEAFSIELRDAKMIGSWDFFDGGNWDILEVEEQVFPLLDQKEN